MACDISGYSGYILGMKYTELGKNGLNLKVCVRIQMIKGFVCLFRALDHMSTTGWSDAIMWQRAIDCSPFVLI